MGHERRQPDARRFTPMQGLRKRADFQAAARGAKAPCTGFVLQVRERDRDGPARVGFTVSRQVGTAVERNRVRRRLREVVRLTPPDRILPGHDYVLIGRRAALELPFQQLRESFEAALRRIHAGSGGRAGHNRKLRGPSPADARTHR